MSSNDASPFSDMMHLLRKYDVAPLCAAMMRCLPQCAARHTSLGTAVIIGAANIICRRQTSFKKRTFVGRQKCVFCWRRRRDLKLLRNPSCGSRKNLRGSPTHFLDFFDRCANPFSLHPLRGAQKRSPRRSPALGFIPIFAKK